MDYRLYDVLRGYCVTEKASIASESMRYTFKVSKDASKANVKRAVEEIFGVGVVSVNIANVQGKVKVFKGHKGRRRGYKKAVVRVDKKIQVDGVVSGV